MKLITSVVISILITITSIVIDEHKNKTTATKNNIKIVLDGVRSTEGKIVVAVFKDQEDFKSRKPVKRIEFNKINLDENQIVMSLETGIYGISVFDDENDNNKMDYNFLGIPKEGFGFSNYYHTGLSKPHFDDFKFEIIDTSEKLINITLRYM
ncbi:DUF2141 domain-containing protein [Psychroserpens jangbogonensis]|uniref:DUF2141 domain-containing protein n=1 Tax=Psychroserpens jangbogonensis TaxID=1484460 RepID=UPI00068A1125|nr:DUF2141 domain-containing protein [Psychroserpens jangbogonensis]